MSAQVQYLKIIILIMVCLLGLHLRMVSIADTQVIQPLRADALEYFMYALNLRTANIYSKSTETLENSMAKPTPDAVRTPGYPLFLALFLDGYPNDRTLARILVVQALMSSLMVVAAFFLFRKFLSFGWACASAFLTALSPHLVVSNSYLLTETLFAFLLVITIWVGSNLGGDHPTVVAILTGVLLGLTALVRPTVQYFPIALALLMVLYFGWRQGLKKALLIILGFILIYSPWLIRNTVVLHKAGDQKLMINFLHHGMYPNFTFDGRPETFGFPYRFDPRTEEISKDLQSVVHEIYKSILHDPVRIGSWFLFGKPFYFWSWDIIQGMGDAFVYPVRTSPYFHDNLFQCAHAFMKWSHWPLVLCCMVGTLAVRHSFFVRDMTSSSIFAVRLVAILILYFTVFHMIGAPFPRYSVPVRPFMYGMAMFLLNVVFKTLCKKWRQIHSTPIRKPSLPLWGGHS